MPIEHILEEASIKRRSSFMRGIAARHPHGRAGVEWEQARQTYNLREWDKKAYEAMRAAEAAAKTEELGATVAALERVLQDGLTIDAFLDVGSLNEYPAMPVFALQTYGLAEPPVIEAYLPAARVGWGRLLPGTGRKHVREVEAAYRRFEEDLAVYRQRESAAYEIHSRRMADLQRQTAANHSMIDAFAQNLLAGAPEAIVLYARAVLAASPYPNGFPQRCKVAYVAESKQLVVEYDLPAFSTVPQDSACKYVKSKDEITATSRPAAQRKALYASLIAQIALRSIHEVFQADRYSHIDCIVLNGYCESIDPATGRPVRPCLVTVRTARALFEQLDLSRVEPVACLKALSASMSRSPAELAPVRPVLEFDMVDPRFIAQTDVLSDLDSRPNLMDLNPGEFEALIANLFEKMGLETRLTQASRDGGVDCVAYDPRPILGGKVVIQAKRYKNTVGVSAVRDLFGTVQNEGASKGILVTTSGYGKAAFEFAQGKPLELLSGVNLLYLLSEHAGIEAKIEMPVDWKDPEPDGQVAV
jgi:restriction system protein